MDRLPHAPLMERYWELRDNVTGYDAAYIALAEFLDVPLLTADATLTRAPAAPLSVRDPPVHRSAGFGVGLPLGWGPGGEPDGGEDGSWQQWSDAHLH